MCHTTTPAASLRHKTAMGSVLVLLGHMFNLTRGHGSFLSLVQVPGNQDQPGHAHLRPVTHPTTIHQVSVNHLYITSSLDPDQAKKKCRTSQNKQASTRTDDSLEPQPTTGEADR